MCVQFKDSASKISTHPRFLPIYRRLRTKDTNECLYQKSACKEYRTEGVYCRYILRKRISVLAFSGECSKVKDEFVVGKTGSDGY